MRAWIAVVSLLWPSLLLAQHEGHGGHPSASAPAREVAVKRLPQTACPVTVRPVSTEHFTEREGQKVFFCSNACTARFKKSPDSYLPALYAQWYPQSVQIKCPVMGGTVDGKTFTEFKGQQIAFCCPSCIDEFKADPAKSLAKLESLSTRQVHCPVTGGAIDPQVSTIHQGKPVYFSSKESLAQFKADPRKYADKLLPEQGVLARGATADEDLLLCPVCAESGGGVHTRKQVTAVALAGKAFFTCSSGCEKKLKESPAKYETLARTRAEKAAALSEWYTCPMHPDVLQKGPGKCPKCAMDLQPLKPKAAGASRRTPAADGAKQNAPANHGNHQGH